MSYFTISYPINIHTKNHDIAYNDVKRILDNSIKYLKLLFSTVNKIDEDDFKLSFNYECTSVSDCIVYDRYGSIVSDNGEIYKTYGLIFESTKMNYIKISAIISKYEEISYKIQKLLNKFSVEFENDIITVSLYGSDSLEQIMDFTKTNFNDNIEEKPINDEANNPEQLYNNDFDSKIEKNENNDIILEETEIKEITIEVKN